MAEFEVGGQLYRTKRMPARTQLQLLRSIGPLFGPMVQMSVVALLPTDAVPADAEAANPTATRMAYVGSFFRAFSQMSNTELEELTNQVLAGCQRRAGGNGHGEIWVDMWNAQARRDQFEDYDLTTLVHLSWNVIQENLSGFFATGLGQLAELSGATLPTPFTASNGSASPTEKTS